jgi:hypothetical protein
MSFEDRNWDAFQRNWLAALARRDVDGAAIRIDADGAESGPVSVHTAFEYASGCPGRSPYDSPEWAARPRTAGEMTLSERPVTALVAA